MICPGDFGVVSIQTTKKLLRQKGFDMSAPPSLPFLGRLICVRLRPYRSCQFIDPSCLSVGGGRYVQKEIAPLPYFCLPIMMFRHFFEERRSFSPCLLFARHSIL